ncbi:MAG: iron uptake transporter permease EfeU [Micrococcales bacterium]
MFANYLIGLREGLEAALIVGILCAYLVKLGRTRDISKIMAGVALAIALCIGVGLLLTAIESSLPQGTEEIIAGFTSLIAVVFVTWMIFWMAKEARHMGVNLRGRVDTALGGSVISLALVAFFAVIREGIETSILLWSSTKSLGQDSAPIWGAFLGLSTAAVLGYLLYKGALKVNLSLFFKWTGAYLIVVAAGILSYGIHELQEIGWLPILGSDFYNFSAVISEGSVVEAILKGMVSFDSSPSWLQAVAWVLYLVPVAALYWRSTVRKVGK